MSELSFMGKLMQAMELSKAAHTGLTLTYFDVIELSGEIEALKGYIAELEAENDILKDHLREAKNILIDKNLQIDSLYEEGYKLHQRIAELEAHIAALEEAYARKLKSGTTFPIFQNRRR